MSVLVALYKMCILYFLLLRVSCKMCMGMGKNILFLTSHTHEKSEKSRRDLYDNFMQDYERDETVVPDDQNKNENRCNT